MKVIGVKDTTVKKWDALYPKDLGPNGEPIKDNNNICYRKKLDDECDYFEFEVSVMAQRKLFSSFW